MEKEVISSKIKEDNQFNRQNNLDFILKNWGKLTESQKSILKTIGVEK